MTRSRTNLSGMTEEEKKEHRRKKSAEKSQRWRTANAGKHREQVKEWQQANPERLQVYQQVRSQRQNERLRNDAEFAERRRAQWRDWNAKHREYRREYDRQHSYDQTHGATPEIYDALVVSQGGRCGICETDKSGGSKRWHVDHNHQTGVIRGLLCAACNRGGGMFKDDPNLLRKAADWFGK